MVEFQNTLGMVADELGGPLEARGYVHRRQGEYRRPDGEGGFDRVLLRLNGQRLDIMLSYYPSELAELESLLGPGEEMGFPCGPYLTSKGVFKRSGGWRLGKGREADLGVLAAAREALESLGEAWLKSLRDPEVLERAVDPQALVPRAVALERAGDPEGARACYQAMMDRFKAAFEAGGGERWVLRDSGRLYVLVAEKLGVDPERVHRFRDSLGYHEAVGRIRARAE